MPDMRLNDYRPVSKLRLPEHRIEKPRFGVVDAHNHLGAPIGLDWENKPFEQLIAQLDEAGVTHYVDLDGGWGEDILQRHLDSEGVNLELNIANGTVLTDRVILRQILISLFNYALHIQSDQCICISTQTENERASVEFKIAVDQDWASWNEEQEDWLSSVRLWSERLDAEFHESYPQLYQSGMVWLRFNLPIANQTTVLVVDDQQPTLRMYQRYLSRSNFKVVGVNDPHQVFPLLAQLQPDLILLDVMMPQVDGWEILQGLQLDNVYRHIPVIVCSAWESGDLAKSLGAAEYLKKPITQERLLAAIQELDL